MAPVTHYSPLNDASLGDRYPSVALENCVADPISGRGGKKRWRLCFLDASLEPYRVVVFVRERLQCHCWMPRGYHHFTVRLNGLEQSVWLHGKSLTSRFGISDRLLRYVVSRDDLMYIVLLKILESNIATAPKLAKIGRDLFFSAKDCKTLKESVYIGENSVFFAIKNSLVGEGTFAKVKKAKTLSGEIIARRIWVVTDETQVQKVLQIMKDFNGKPGILKLLGVVSYTNWRGQKVVVTFHPLLKEDLFNLFSAGRELSEERRLSYAAQLFRSLQSLDGAHGDLKPENILIDEEQLVLTDLEFYADKDTKRVKRGTPEWSAPEIFLMKDITAKKLDVWALGIILFYLFTYPYLQAFTWQDATNIQELTRSFDQHSTDEHIASSPLSAEKKALISRMIVVDVEQRYTIDEAAAHFYNKIK